MTGDKKNTMELIFDSYSENEGFARVSVAAFCMRLDPTVEEISDIKTAVSEAVTNCVVHGYENTVGKIRLSCSICEDVVEVIVHDDGVGIVDIKKAMEPLFTTKPELERSGMGFSFMEAFMDEVYVESTKKTGTTVTMRKRLEGSGKRV